jgi:hypothetical protein
MSKTFSRTLAPLALLIASSLFGATPAQEAELAIVELQKKIPAAAPASSASTTVGAQQTAHFQNSLTYIRASLARGDLFEAERMLTNARFSVASDPALVALIDEATAILKKSADALESANTAALEAITENVRQKMAARAPAKDFDALLTELNKLSPSRIARNYQENGPAQQIESLRNFISRWQDYTNHTALGNADQAANSLQQLADIAARSNIVPRSELLALQQSIAQAREAGTTAIAARITDLASRLQAALVTDAKPSALDPFLEEIGALRQQLEKQRSSGTQDQHQRLHHLRRLTTTWQDYLTQLAAGNRSAHDVLRNLANDSQLDAVFPRSKLLAIVNKSTADASGAQPAATPPAPETLTLDNLDAFAARISALPRNTFETSQTAFAHTLASLQQSASQIKAGNEQTALTFLRTRTIDNAPPQYREALQKIRTELTAAAIVLLLEPPKDLLIGENENLLPYVTRVLRTASERRDWALARRSVEALGTLGANFEAAAYRLFFAAQNFERVGQTTSAVQYYLGSLRTGSQNLPIEEIAARLKALKEQFPKEFEQGEKMPFPSPAIPSVPGESRVITPSVRPGSTIEVQKISPP